MCVCVVCVCVCAYWQWKMAALVHSCSDGVGQSSPARCEHVAAGYTRTSVSSAPGESQAGWVIPLGRIADSSVRRTYLRQLKSVLFKLTLGSVVLDAHARLVKRLYTCHGGKGSPFGLYCRHLNQRDYP